MRNKLLTILFLLIILSTNSFGQTNQDVKNCLMQTFDITEIHSTLFSLRNEKGDSILCIQADYYPSRGKNFKISTDEFIEYKEHDVYVKSPAFIEMYSVEYWLSIDSIDAQENRIEIHFKTTTLFFENTNYTYFQGKVVFEKKKNKWLLAESEFDFGKYIPPYVIDNEYINNVKERNRKLKEELKKKKKE